MTPKKAFIPSTIMELREKLSAMFLSAPTFIDKTGHLPFLNLDYVFMQLTQGLTLNRSNLGDGNYAKLMDMTNAMRPLFEADPEDKTGEAVKGQAIINDMLELLEKLGKRT